MSQEDARNRTSGHRITEHRVPTNQVIMGRDKRLPDERYTRGRCPTAETAENNG